MQKLHLILFLFVFLASCEKEDTLNSEIPEWIKPRIEELENSEHCLDCSLTRITYQKEYYYNIYCGFWSCVYCELYNNNGKLVSEVEGFDFEDFFTNKKDAVVLWRCSK